MCADAADSRPASQGGLDVRMTGYWIRSTRASPRPGHLPRCAFLPLGLGRVRRTVRHPEQDP